MKVLLSLMGEMTPDVRQRRLAAERDGSASQWSVFEALFQTEAVDCLAIRNAPWYRRAVYKFLPKYCALAFELFLIRGQYDVVVTAWSEPLSVSFAFLQLFSRHRKPHVMAGYWFSKVSIAPALRLVHPAISRIVSWSSVQATFATEKLGVPASKIRIVKHPVDPVFWGKRETGNANPSKDYICAAGAEMRDYPTLIEAMRELPQIQCRIAAREIRILTKFKAVNRSAQELASTLPPNVTVRAYSQVELRALVQQSRFVVVPLLPTDTDNGITVILEAMAAGKAVLCTKTRGQVDAITDGKNGILVPPSSPNAMKQAMASLWADPEKSNLIGKNAREYILASRHPLELFTQDLVAITQEVVDSSKHTG